MVAPGLTIPLAHWQQLLRHVAACAPEEACGLLGGVAGVVQVVYVVENIRHSPTAYELDPAQQVAAFIEMETRGQELLGIFHSHPAGPPHPSPTDVQWAYYPEAVYLIFAPGPAGAWHGRGFYIVHGQVTDAPVTLLPLST